MRSPAVISNDSFATCSINMGDVRTYQDPGAVGIRAIPKASLSEKFAVAVVLLDSHLWCRRCVWHASRPNVPRSCPFCYHGRLSTCYQLSACRRPVQMSYSLMIAVTPFTVEHMLSLVTRTSFARDSVGSIESYNKVCQHAA